MLSFWQEFWWWGGWFYLCSKPSEIPFPAYLQSGSTWTGIQPGLDSLEVAGKQLLWPLAKPPHWKPALHMERGRGEGSAQQPGGEGKQREGGRGKRGLHMACACGRCCLPACCCRGGGFSPLVAFVEDWMVLLSVEVVRKTGFCFPDSCIDHRPI